MNGEGNRSPTPLDGGACMDLLPEVFDKYFTAERWVNPFEHYTARAICGGCAIRMACLTDAIGSEALAATGAQYIIRGGESGFMIKSLRERHFLRGESTED